MIEQHRNHSNAIALMLVTLAGTAVALAVVYSILTSRWNNLSQFAIYLAGAGFVAGFINPRAMLYPFVIATAFLDLFKRLLILYDRPNILDLYFVLGIAPMMMSGIFAGTLVGAAFGKYRVENKHILLLGISMVFILVSSVSAFRGSGVTVALKTVADHSAYSVFLFVIPVLFQKWEEVWKFFRFALVVFVPVGLYAIYQSVFGLSDFEISYLKSGLTIMVKELDDIRPRPFSTLNSAHTLAYTSAILVSLCCFPFAMGRDGGTMFRHRWVYAPLGVFFLVVCLVTMARSGNVLWIIALGALFTFVSRVRVAAFYVTVLAGFVTLVLFAETIMLKLPEWDAKLDKSNEFMSQATRIQTFYHRLYSYSQLKQPENYSAFGVEGEVFTHDALTEALVKHGVVPLAVILLLGLVSLKKLHRSIFRIRSRGIRNGACLLLGIALATVLCDLFFGSTAKSFPVNAYLWITLGGVLVMLFQQEQEQERELEPESPADPEPIPIVPPIPQPSRP